MNSPLRKILLGTSVFVIATIVAVIGYWMAGWSLLESIYMVTITIYGVGYGEVRPIDDPRLMLFTIGVIVAGCTSAIYVLGGFVQMIAEGEINRVLGARRMTKGIERLTNHVIVCGYGRVGQILARELADASQDFVIVDTNQERLRQAEQQGFLVVLGDATEEFVLESAGVERASVLACVLPDDVKNVFITLTAHDLNPKLEIVARGESPSSRQKLLRSGASRVVLPATIGATKIAQLILRPSAESLLAGDAIEDRFNDELQQIGLNFHEVRIQEDSPLIDTPLSELEVCGATGWLVVAIRRADGSVERSLTSQVGLRADDTVILLGHCNSIPELRQRAERKQVTYRGARL
ncbi:Voltage-gated potassium channel Kch [Maioricimonas rarisocia]|uniref:Trk system potassium uptake protein TrkA n=1 Tax=Maioricimonas rarisocia TaxID=2528026 RepID=A0A517Z1B0_9PLAN|nr:potassium channel protein [Maioricimonas rarisocia]QDU36262.1 Voltage-gated potassium channel Kch [Maioricimonas rarisocia]